MSMFLVEDVFNTSNGEITSLQASDGEPNLESCNVLDKQPRRSMAKLDECRKHIMDEMYK